MMFSKFHIQFQRYFANKRGCTSPPGFTPFHFIYKWFHLAWQQSTDLHRIDHPGSSQNQVRVLGWSGQSQSASTFQGHPAIMETSGSNRILLKIASMILEDANRSYIAS
jgi:hypothetical protein